MGLPLRRHRWTRWPHRQRGRFGRRNDAGPYPHARGDIESLLANNDSYKALALAGDHIMIGATGTNVADIQICLVDKT